MTNCINCGAPLEHNFVPQKFTCNYCGTDYSFSSGKKNKKIEFKDLNDHQKAVGILVIAIATILFFKRFKN